MEYEINERLKMLRDHLGLSQEAFGARVGMSRSEIKNLEYQKTALKEFKIPLICDAFNVSEHWLRTGEGDMFAKLDRDEEITLFVAQALNGEDETFKKRFLSMMAKLTEDEWVLLEKMAKKIAGEE